MPARRGGLTAGRAGLRSRRRGLPSKRRGLPARLRGLPAMTREIDQAGIAAAQRDGEDQRRKDEEAVQTRHQNACPMPILKATGCSPGRRPTGAATSKRIGPKPV